MAGLLAFADADQRGALVSARWNVVGCDAAGDAGRGQVLPARGPDGHDAAQRCARVSLDIVCDDFVAGDALARSQPAAPVKPVIKACVRVFRLELIDADRKSTRLNYSHVASSYAVCS